MATQIIPGTIVIPQVPTAASEASNGTLDASGEKFAVVFHAPRAGDIAKVAWKVGTATTGGDLDIRLEDIDAATGFPDGNLIAVNANGTQTITTTNNAWYTTTLTSSPTVTQGQLIGAVLVATDAIVTEIDGSGNDIDFPYGLIDTGGGFSSVTRQCILAIEYSDGSYFEIPGLKVFSLRGVTASYGSSSTPDEIGIRFKWPVPVQAVGFHLSGELDGVADVVLYEGTSQLTAISLDPDIRGTTGVAPSFGIFPASQSLAADTVYHLTLKPTSATTVRLNTFTFDSNALLDAADGGTLEIYHAERTDAGAFSYDTAKRPVLHLLVNAFDDGAGGAGGGLLTHPGMAGGMRG